jgi:hypothetical protein
MSGRRGAAVLAVVALVLAGCGGGPKTHPVRGKVVVADGDVAQLADGHVEFVREDDPGVRADGLIGPDGRFEMQTQLQGKLLTGAAEGTYRARIILPDADGGGGRRRPRPIHDRFLDFKTSGLTFQVPTDGEITVTVSRK